MERTEPLLSQHDVILWQGDCLEILKQWPRGFAHSCVTSPPYLDVREDYPCPTLEQFAELFAELHRLLTGPMCWNVGRIWRERTEQLWWVDLIAAARNAGWRHEDTRVWVKPNANPIRGELFVDNHEYVLCFGGEGRPFFTDSIRVAYQPGSIERLRRRHVSHVGVKNDVAGGYSSRHDRSAGAGGRQEPNEVGARAPSYMVASVGKEKGNSHPAPMPLEVADELVLMTTPPGKVVLDPFMGSGTTLRAARRFGRRALGIELSAEYAEMARAELAQMTLDAELQTTA